MSEETRELSSSPKTLDDLLAEYIAAEESGRALDAEALYRQHPEHATELREFLANRRQMRRLAEPLQGAAGAGRRNGHSLGKVRYFGDYELLEEVAAGGMGIVYKARQVSLNRVVAVKMILKGTLASEDDVKRFRAEAEAAANLQHPGIVAIHEVGLHEGQHYFSMDFVEGYSLAQLPRENPLSAKQAAEYVRNAAEAVHYAHQQGTLHRDLKPSNILIDRQNRVRITDFGLAKRIEGDSDLTLTGQILGTPSYMPPEQALCKRSLIGTASDVYSLGAVLYELITGRPPFRGESVGEILRQVETRDPVAPRLLSPTTPRDLETICLKCLEKESHKRYQTAQQLSDDLGRFLRHDPILARPITRRERAWRWCRRNPGVASLSAAVLILLVLTSAASSIGFFWAKKALVNEQERRRLEESNQLARVTELIYGPRPDFEQAEHLLTTALVERPADAQLLAHRAQARFERGDLNGTISDAEESLRLEAADNAAVRLLLVEAAVELGNDKLAQQAHDELARRHAASTESAISLSLLDPLDSNVLPRLSQEVERDPLNYRLRYFRARAAEQWTQYRTSKRNYDLAVSDLERVLSARPFDLRARQVLCSLLVQFHFLADVTERPLPRAKTLLDQWLAERPNDVTALILAAQWHQEVGEPEAALEFCRRGRLIRLTRPELALLEGDALHELRRYNEAEDAYESLRLLLEERPRLIIPMSTELIPARRAVLARSVRAGSATKSIVEAFPTLPPHGRRWSYHEWRTLVEASHFDQGICERWRSAMPEAPGPDEALGIAEDNLVTLTTALELGPSLRRARRERARLLVARGAYREALTDLEIFAVSFPEDAQGIHELANMLMTCPELPLRNLSRARDFVAQIVALRPRRAATWALLARAELQLGNREAALAAVQSALKLGYDEELVLLQIDILLELSRCREAEDLMEAIVRTKSSGDTLRFGVYSQHLSLPGHQDQRLYARSLELAKSGPPDMVTLGVALYRNGQWTQAIEQLNNRPAVGGYFRAMALWQSGDKEGAWRTYQELSREAATRLVLLDTAQRQWAAARREAAALLGIPLNEEAVKADIRGRNVQPGDWPQWGGWAGRNNVSSAATGPLNWVAGQLDRKTRQWQRDTSRNVKWVAPLGSLVYGNPVVANGKVFVGTNNSHAHLKRYPADVDLGVLLCLKESDGSFLWQLSCPKLTTGRVHDWPLIGLCSAPLAEGDRLWLVTNRAEILCLDAEGFLDGEDDGPDQGYQEFLFQAPALNSRILGQWSLPPQIRDALVKAEQFDLVKHAARIDERGKRWTFYKADPIQQGRFLDLARVELIGDKIRIQPLAADKSPAGEAIEVADVILPGHATPAVLASLQESFNRHGVTVPPVEQIRTLEEGAAWAFDAKAVDESAQVVVRFDDGYYFAERRQMEWPSQRQEADVIWRLNLMTELGVSPHNMSTCAPTAWGDTLFFCTGNGVDESHSTIPNPNAPSFIALDKRTGEILWTDDSPGKNIQHGQWSAPAVGVIGGVPQVIFGGGDGWLYAFHAEEWQDKKPQLLWKFDTNPKDAVLELGGRGTRNEPFAMPVIYDGLVYVTTGQDPEHGEGTGHLWCIDPTRRGDISLQLAVNIKDRTQPIPHKRTQAVVADEGDIAIDNPNSGVVWHYNQIDRNGDKKYDFEEIFHRSIASPVVRNDVLFAVDFSGLGHCLNAKTGELYWTYDFLAAVWATPLVVGDRVYVGDEDGEMTILRLHPEPYQFVRTTAAAVGMPWIQPDPLQVIPHPNSAYTTPVMANGVFYLATQNHLLAIAEPPPAAAPAAAAEKSGGKQASSALSSK